MPECSSWSTKQDLVSEAHAAKGLGPVKHKKKRQKISQMWTKLCQQNRHNLWHSALMSLYFSNQSTDWSV
jgi:hypothetical protein